MKRIGLGIGLLGLVALGHAAATLPVAPTGLAAEWHFSEGSGTTAADSSGNNFNGTLTNGVAWTTGRIGSGLSFDGVNDYVNLGTNVNLLNNVPAATVSLWLKPGSTIPAGSFRELVSISVASSTPTNSSRVALSLQGDGSAGDLYAGARATDTETQKILSANTNLAVGTWVHVAGVYDFAGNTIKLYLNGNLVATNAAAGFAAAATSNTPSKSLALGAQDMGDSNFYKGLMDEVRIYRRALSASEVQALALADQLQGRWSLDEGAGTTAGDSSDNALTGTLRNTPTWTTGVMGGALHFNGVNQSVDLGANLPLLRNVNAATVSTWVRPGSTIAPGAFRELVSISVNSGSPTNTSRLALSLQGDGTGGDIFLGGRSTETETQKNVVADTSLAPGTWYHVAGVVDYAQGTISIYLNGNLVKSGPAAFTQSHTPNTPATNGALGAQDTGDSNFFQGDLDEVRVYGRALSACEISDLALKDGLHIYLKMDESTGTTTADASGHGISGTLKNGAVFAAGQFGNGVSFDGSNDYVDLGSNLDALTSTHGSTLATWVKPTSVPASGIYADLISISVNSPGGPTDTSRAVLSLVGDGTAADVFAGGRSTDAETQQTATANANLAAGTWTHVAAVIDYAHNTIAVYKNGVLVLTQAVAFSQPTTPSTVSTNAALGSQDKGDGNFFRGVMDEVRVYCRALSAAEIAAIAAPGVPAAPTLLTAAGGNSRVDLTWSSVAGATSYNVKRDTSATGAFPTIANVGTTSYADLGVTNGTTYYYKISAQNLAGEGPNSNSLSATPNPPATLPAPMIVTPTGAINTTAPTVTGTSSATGLTITLYVDGVANGTTSSVVAGNWSLIPTNPLSEGLHTLTAKASNGTQTSAFSAGVSIRVDTTLPVISSPSPANGSTVFTATPVVSASWSDSGSGLSLGTAAITLDGAPVSATTIATGFSFTAAPLAQGSHTVSAQVQDQAANLGSLSWSFSVLLPPPAPSITSPASGAILATGAPTVTGTSSASGLTITLFVDGVNRGSATSGTGGAWSLVPNVAAADGVHTLTATAANAAGASAPSAGVLITVDRIAPVITIVSPANVSSLPTLRPAVSATVTDVGGSGADPLSVAVFLDGVSLMVSVTPAGSTDLNVTFSPTSDLSVGPHTLTVDARDRAGNAGIRASSSFTLSAPGLTVTNPSIANGGFTSQTRPAFSATLTNAAGTGINAGTVVVFLDGVAISASVTAVNSNSVNISFTPGSNLSPGGHQITAQWQTTQGSTITSPVVSFGVDTVLPVIASASPADGSFLQAPRPTVSAGVADSGGSGLSAPSLILQVNGIIVPAGVTLSDPDHAVVSYAPPSDLSEGSYAATFFASDRAGNDALSVTVHFVVDHTAPTVVFTSPVPTPSYTTNSVSLDLSITDQVPGSGLLLGSVQVFLNGDNVTPQVSISQDTASHIGITGALASLTGGNSVQVQVSDNAGNSRSGSVSYDVSGGTVPVPIIVPRPVVDIEAVTQPPGGAEAGNRFYQVQGRPIMFQVRATVGGANQEEVDISPEITSGRGHIFFTPSYPQKSDASGMAGFGFIPTRVGDVTIVVKSKVGEVGQTAQFNLSATQLNPVINFIVTAYPGSSFAGHLTAERADRVTVYLDEVDDQHVPISDPSSQKLTFYNQVYTTGSDGMLDFPFQVKSAASPDLGATIRATFPEFRDQTGKPIEAFTTIGIIDSSMVDSTTVVLGGAGQTFYPGKMLDQDIVIQANVPDDEHTVVQAHVSGPGTLIAPAGGVVTYTPDHKTVVVETSTGGTLTVKYKADDGQVQPATILTGALSMFQAPTPGLVLNGDSLAQHLVVLAPQLEYVADSDSKELVSLPVGDVDEILNGTITADRYVHVEATVPHSAIGANTMTVPLQALGEDGNPLNDDHLFPPTQQTLTLTRQGQTDKFVSTPFMTTPGRKKVDTVPSLAFTPIRLGRYMLAMPALSALNGVQQQAQPVMTPDLVPGIPPTTGPPNDFVYLVNGMINAMDGPGADSAFLSIDLNPVVPPGAPGPVTIQGSQLSGGVAQQLGDFYVADQAAARTFDQPPDVVARGITYIFDVPQGFNHRQSTLTFAMQNTGLAVANATARVPVRLSKYAGTIRVTYHYLLSPGEGGLLRWRSNQLDRTHDIVRQIWLQAGVRVLNAAAGVGYPVLAGQPLTMTSYDQSAASFTAFRNLHAAVPTNVSIFYIDTIPVPPGQPTLGGLTATYPLTTIKRWSVVTRDVFGFPTVNSANTAHELGHALGLDDVTLPPNDLSPLGINLMMNRPPLRTANYLFDILVSTLNTGFENQMTITRQVAGVLNQE